MLMLGAYTVLHYVGLGSFHSLAHCSLLVLSSDGCKRKSKLSFLALQGGSYACATIPWP